MMPRTAKRIIFNGLKDFVNKGETNKLYTNRCLNAIYKSLYKAMKSEGMNVKMVEREIDLSEIQEHFNFMFDLQNQTFTTGDAYKISDRFETNPYRLFHLYMALINYSLVDNNKDRFLKI